MRVTTDGKNPVLWAWENSLSGGSTTELSGAAPELVAVGHVLQYGLFACRTEQNGSLLNYDTREQRNFDWDNARPR